MIFIFYICIFYMETTVNYKMLYVITSKKNPNYTVLHNLLQKQELVNKLNEKNINVMETADEDYDKFTMSLYNCDMSLIASYNEVNERIINEILNIIDKIDKMTKNQKGGNMDYYKEQYYKYKYKKYRTKYKQLKYTYKL